MTARRADRPISQTPAETQMFTPAEKRGGTGGASPISKSSLPLRSGEREKQLTSRERQILGLFARGMRTAAIALRLSISTTTVRNHSQRILAKLRVHSRLHAVAVGYASGLIRVPMPSARPREERS